jgi:hypothetical protein
MGNALPKLVTSGVLGVILGFLLGAKSTQKKLPASPPANGDGSVTSPNPLALARSETSQPGAPDGVEEDLQAARAARAADRPGHMTANRILADKHRVAVTQWTLIGASSVNYSERFEEPRSAARPNGGECPLTDELDSVFSWVKEHRYDGLEMTVDDFRVRWFPEENYETIVEKVVNASTKAGVPVLGSLYHVTDGCAALACAMHPSLLATHRLAPQTICAVTVRRARELGDACTPMAHGTTSTFRTKTSKKKWVGGSAMKKLLGVGIAASKSACRATSKTLGASTAKTLNT